MSLPPPNPITPKEARRRKGGTLPPEVLEAFNDLLSERYSDQIEITQPEVITLILKKFEERGREG